MLNAVLTVRAHDAASHGKQGWETFTDAAISVLSARRRGLVFLLWGRYAQQKAALIDSKKHHILKAAHPSGFSANKVQISGYMRPTYGYACPVDIDLILATLSCLLRAAAREVSSMCLPDGSARQFLGQTCEHLLAAHVKVDCAGVLWM